MDSEELRRIIREEIAAAFRQHAQDIYQASQSKCAYPGCRNPDPQHSHVYFTYTGGGGWGGDSKPITTVNLGNKP